MTKYGQAKANRRQAANRRKQLKRREILDFLSTHRRGIPVDIAYDPSAPTLTRVVPGLSAPRVRTVRINGFPLTLVESP